MNILIAAFSMLIYLIILNRSLTFRLTILNNIIITVILGFFILRTELRKSALFVLPMFAILLLYIYWLKKEDVLWNIFLVVLSYMSVVIVDNISHFIWKIAGIEPIKNYLTYTICLIIELPIFYMLCGFFF